MNIDSKIRKIPNWPKPGVLFYDVTTLFEDREAFRYMIDAICEPYKYMAIDKIVGIDARGFLLASSMAYKLNAGVSIVRKKGKLPYKTIARDYSLEYGEATVEIHEDTIKPGERVVIVDDLVATGGTMKATCELVEQLGGIIVGVSWVVDLPFLGGSVKISNYDCHCLIKYNSETTNQTLQSSVDTGQEDVGKIIKVGIIGGSGLENLDILQDKKEEKVNTPYGRTSDTVITGKIEDPSTIRPRAHGREAGSGRSCDVVIIPRHGREHTIKPTDVNYRANIWAMKELGVTHILAPTACGSLKEEIKPGDFVILDQFIDRTTKREQTFYEGRVCHIPMAEPFCPKLRELVYETAQQLGIRTHKWGTAVTIEGPRFSTKAESYLFRQWGADVVNMTTVPEAVLAREAGICYSAIAMATDYDCWRESSEPVTIKMVLETMKQNAEKMERLLTKVISKIDYKECGCKEAIKTAVI